MLAALFSSAHSYQKQLIALYISLSPFVAILALIIAAYIYNRHRNRHRPRPH